MEPLRGGKLADLPEEQAARLKLLRPDESLASWSFRWLMNLPSVRMVLSGMSAFDQMTDNVATFSGGEAQTPEEAALLMELAEEMKDALPCTRCRYCCDGCPMQLDIPMLIHAYNDIRYDGSMTVSMQFDALPSDKLPSACIGCGACAAVCPQGIDIPGALADLTDRLSRLPSWAQICRQRDEEQRRLRGE